MSAIFLGYSVLWHYNERRGIEGLEDVTEHAMMTLEAEAQTALRDAASNFPSVPVLGPLMGPLMSFGITPLGELTRPYRPPGDALTKRVAELVTKPSGMRDLFSEHVYVSGEEGDRMTALIDALPVCLQADLLQTRLRQEKRTPTEDESALLRKAEDMRDEIVQVDVYEKHGHLEQQTGYVRPALLQTEEWDNAASPLPKAA
mmetsp:Transcript_53236/g.72710  ORF Transcript_53236/g.72710 Transcript_53236/m.72710 type:complete len:202 (-) Transcript_53236:168-773(-)